MTGLWVALAGLVGLVVGTVMATRRQAARAEALAKANRRREVEVGNEAWRLLEPSWEKGQAWTWQVRNDMPPLDRRAPTPVRVLEDQAFARRWEAFPELLGTTWCPKCGSEREPGARDLRACASRLVYGERPRVLFWTIYTCRNCNHSWCEK